MARAPAPAGWGKPVHTGAAVDGLHHPIHSIVKTGKVVKMVLTHKTRDCLAEDLMPALYHTGACVRLFWRNHDHRMVESDAQPDASSTYSSFGGPCSLPHYRSKAFCKETPCSSGTERAAM